MKGFTSLIGVIVLLAPQIGYAGTGSGLVKKLLVGRNGAEVYFELEGTKTGFPCSSSHPSGYDYAFSLTGHGAAAELYATLLAAYASGATIDVQGTGACTVESRLEDVSYLVLE